MSILNITLDSTGLVGVNPRLVKILSTDSLATITAQNYLYGAQLEGFQFKPTDLCLVSYNNPSNPACGFFEPSISGGNITLVPCVSNVATPTVVNDIAVFSNTEGAIKDASAVTAAAGNLQAGYSGTAGIITMYPATASKGTLIVEATNNTGNTNVTLTNAAMGQASVISLPDPGASTATVALSPGTGGLVLGNVLNSTSYPVIVSSVTCGEASLASGGSVVLLYSSGSHVYQILDIIMNKGGTNFSGGSGDRLGQVTDGTTVYTVIPATNMQTLGNFRWGVSTQVPFPASAAVNTGTNGGSNLVFKYSGGSTDYTAGSVVITVVAVQVE